MLVKGQLTNIDIDYGHQFNLLECEVVMPVSAVQKMNIVEAYGVDYEKIRGNFIQRSENSSTSGYKRFKFNY